MLSVRRPRARRRKRRRPLHWVGRARRGRRHGREEGRRRETRPLRPGTGVEGQALAGKGSLRDSEAPAWPLGRAERRSGEHRRCRGGSAAGGGGAGPRRLLFSAPLGLGPPPSSPVPYTLHPLLLLPWSDSCFTSPPLGPQEPAAHSEDGGGSAGSSGCGIQYGGR